MVFGRKLTEKIAFENNVCRAAMLVSVSFTEKNHLENDEALKPECLW
jgi:hypothetical protein